MTTKSWRDAKTYRDLHDAGIRGFLFPDNVAKPEAEVVAAVKESLERMEAGDFEEVASIGDWPENWLKKIGSRRNER